MLNLRKEKFDISILPHPSNRFEYNLVSFFAGAKIRLGFTYPYFNIKSMTFLNNKRIPIGDNHEVEENLNLIKQLGVSSNKIERKLFLKISQSNIKNAEDFLKRNKIQGEKIGIHAGSSSSAGMDNKRWPKEKFVELCDYLTYNYKSSILIFGANDEKDLKEYIKNNAELRVLIRQLGDHR